VVRASRVDIVTVAGLGLLLMPLLTMWHEIGGHAAACALQGGRVTEIGAFYANCDGLSGLPRRIVALAGVGVNALLAIAAYALWTRARGDFARLLLWLVWVSEGFVAAGYFLFSGASGVGDLGPGVDGGIGPLANPGLWRIGEFLFGLLVYIWLIRRAIAALTAMLGASPATGPTRRAVAHIYYLVAGIAAVLTGLLNPVGLFITLMSAAASSFGGLAGFISIGFAVPKGTAETGFAVGRSWPLFAAGLFATLAFVLILGPSITFGA
jgi:hypothetical protein